jgi:hypothetical protein
MQQTYGLSQNRFQQFPRPQNCFVNRKDKTAPDENKFFHTRQQIKNYSSSFLLYMNKHNSLNTPNKVRLRLQEQEPSTSSTPLKKEPL